MLLYVIRWLDVALVSLSGGAVFFWLLEEFYAATALFYSSVTLVVVLMALGIAQAITRRRRPQPKPLPPGYAYLQGYVNDLERR